MVAASRPTKAAALKAIGTEPELEPPVGVVSLELLVLVLLISLETAVVLEGITVGDLVVVVVVERRSAARTKLALVVVPFDAPVLVLVTGLVIGLIVVLLMVVVVVVVVGLVVLVVLELIAGLVVDAIKLVEFAEAVELDCRTSRGDLPELMLGAVVVVVETVTGKEGRLFVAFTVLLGKGVVVASVVV